VGLFVSLVDLQVFGNKICQTVGDEIFFPPHIILGVDKQQDLRNEFCPTVRDALIDIRINARALFGSSRFFLLPITSNVWTYEYYIYTIYKTKNTTRG